MTITEKLSVLVEKHADRIYAAERYIWQHPETGYKEWNTSAYLAEQFEQLGYVLVKPGDIPGFYTDLDTGRPGPKVAILGELDSLVVASHPERAEGTCAVHACGHNCQSAALLGVACALKEPGALDGLCGSIRLISVPAEELIELEYREELRRKGVIHYLGGKVEFIYRGYFDGVDIAMMIHAGSLPEGKTLDFSAGMNGCMLKNVTFEGVSAHAGAAPQNGRNALYAATNAINAVNALRETFVDGEHVRFHPILTKGGTVVNAIPEEVRMESYVRGACYESMAANNRRINLAIAASAAAMGCNALLDDHPGYLPLRNDPLLTQVMSGAMREIAGEDSVRISESWDTGSTDMGDVSSIIPSVQPHCSGAVGEAHGASYRIADARLACLLPAQCLAATVGRLLENDAEVGWRVVREAKLPFSGKEEYLAAIDRFAKNRRLVRYNDDGSVTLNLND